MFPLRRTSSSTTCGPALFLALTMVLTLLSSAFVLALHHHEDESAQQHEHCSLCVVGKVAATAPPTPTIVAVAAVPARVESVAPACVPSAPRITLREGRAPPRG